MKIELLRTLISHRPTVLAVGSISHAAQPRAAPSTDAQTALLEQHLKGVIRVGAYTTIPGASLARWCCYDIDGGNHADKNAMADPDAACDALEAQLLSRGVPVLRERSGGGAGWHLWVVFDRLMPAVDVRDWMREMLRPLSLKTRAGDRLDPQRPRGIELFPKQDTLDGGAHGNLVWLPGWGQAPDGELYHKGAAADYIPVYTLTHEAPVAPTQAPGAVVDAGPRVREKDVRAWLSYLDPDDYEVWFKTGMALNSWTRQGGGQGLMLWVDWSKGSDKYVEGACDQKWDSFRRESGTVVGIASLRYAAREAGWTAIKRGSQVEIADHVLDGEVFDGADLYLYGERGIWKRIRTYDVECRVSDLDGHEIPAKDEKSKPKVLNVSADMMSAVAKLCTRRAPEIDPAVWSSQVGFACANGWVTPDGLEPLCREHYARSQLPVAYDPQAKCPRWMRFLEESCDADSALVVQEFVGAALFGDATRYERALVLWGDGGNGKSVFANTIRLLFDKESVSSYAPQQFHDNGIKAALRLARLNVVMELPERELIDTSSLKAIITGDNISARRPYDVEPLSFDSKAAHLFCCNALPETRNTDRGFWRRWITVGFTRTPTVVDQYLKQKLEGEVAGIVAWGVAGFERLKRQGRYTEPDSATEIQRSWARNTNPYERFFTQVLVPDAAAKTSSAKIYATYRRWCELSGCNPAGAAKFGAEIKRFIDQGRTSAGSFYAARVSPEGSWDLLG
jgi:P4 family phage/plasmid primase-like protien